MVTAQWIPWLLLIALGACSKPKDRALSLRLRMSYDDLAKQDPNLVEEIKSNLKNGDIQYTTTFKRFEILDLRKNEPLFVFHDVEVGLGFMYDWAVYAKIRRRSGATLHEVQGILRGIQARGVPCWQTAGSTWPMDMLEREAPCNQFGTSSSGLTCGTSFEDMEQYLYFSVFCEESELPSSPHTLSYDLDFGFSFYDAMRWLKPHYEAKYGPLGLDPPRYRSPQEIMELWDQPGTDREKLLKELREGTL